MTTNFLYNILAVENELQGREEEETLRAEKWLAEQKAALQAEFAQRRDELAKEMEAALKQARVSAERKTAVTINSTEQRAKRLAGISDEALRRILAPHLLEMVRGSLP